MENVKAADTPRNPPNAISTQPTINTYHCLCTNLLLATTHTLSSLSSRSGDALDHALILPSPPLPRRILLSVSSQEPGADHDPDPDSDSDPDSNEPSNGLSLPTGATIAISMPRAAQPVIIRRSDGFEKRWLLRCGRCRLVVGYQLDEGQFDAEKASARREDVMYILPGALRTTDDMVSGKKVSEKDVALGIEGGG